MTTGAIVLDGPSPNRRKLRIPARACTLDGFNAWAESDQFPKRGRFSFINGSIYVDVSPEEIETHNKVKGVISRVASSIADDEDLGEFYFDRTLVANRRARLSTEPDGTFVRWASFRRGRVRRIPRRDRVGEYIRLEGAPDWILEVVSRSSFNKDTVILPLRYHRAKVGEVWLVDATGEDVDFRILLWKESGYVPSRTRDGWQYSPVFKRFFRLRRQRARLGGWRYILETKNR